VYRFSAAPLWALTDASTKAPEFEPLAPIPTVSPEVWPRVLARIEYRTLTLTERIELALKTGQQPAVLARPPNDLPALLRTADQLLTFARQESGEKASVWRCECGTRYAVPVSLLRTVSIRCEHCGRTVDLDPDRTAGESFLPNPELAAVNELRRSLSAFFREAMARGWLVLVSKG
jgi:hypothetical protein